MYRRTPSMISGPSTIRNAIASEAKAAIKV